MSEAKNWSAGARVGFGCGLCVGSLLISFLIPAVRRYVAYEWEVQPKRLFVGRILALVALGVQSGAVINNLIESTNDDFDCKTPGCGNSWEDSSGNPTESVSRYIMMKGVFSTVALMLVQQSIFWVPEALRGLTTLAWLVAISAIEYIGWYIPYMAGAGPFQWESELYRVFQYLPMICAIVAVWPYYRYNDTLLGPKSEDSLTGDVVPDSVKVNYHSLSPQSDHADEPSTTIANNSTLLRTTSNEAPSGGDDRANRSDTMADDFFRT